jgi:hypothetical protein
MAKLVERRTVVVDLQDRRRFVLPEYIYDFRGAWPSITGKKTAAGKEYTFSGREDWLPY